MRSKNWSFNLSLPVIRKDLTRFWPVWGSYLAIWLLILPIPLLTNGFDDYGQATMARDIQSFLVDLGSVASLMMSAIYGGLSAFAVWSYLYQSRSASLFHALPVTRNTLFTSHFTAGLGFLVLPNVVIAALAWLVQASLGYFDPSHLLCWLAITCLEGLLFFSIGTLAAHMTGSLPTMPVLYALLNFAVVVYETLLLEYATMLYFGITTLRARFTLFSPFIHLINQDVRLYQHSTQPNGTIQLSTGYFDPAFLRMLCLYALAALVMAAVALALYRGRSTEAAGDVIAIPALRPLAKYAFAFGCALTLGWLLLEVVFSGSDHPLVILFSLALAGTVGYLAASMLLKKSFRVFRGRQLWGLPALWLALALIVGCFHYDLLGTERYVPDESVLESATLSAQYKVVGSRSKPEVLRSITDLHRAILAEQDLLEAFSADRSGQWVTLRFNYILTNGRSVSRRYYVPYSALTAADPTTLVGKAAVLLDDPRLILEECLPPDNAVIESLSMYLAEGMWAYAEPQWRNDLNTYVDTAHIPVLRQALKEDILAGRLARWQRSGSELLCSFEFRYDIDEKVPLNTESTVVAAAPGEYVTKESSRWCSVALYLEDEPSATLEALTELGYLTEVPHG